MACLLTSAARTVVSSGPTDCSKTTRYPHLAACAVRWATTNPSRSRHTSDGVKSALSSFTIRQFRPGRRYLWRVFSGFSRSALPKKPYARTQSEPWRDEVEAWRQIEQIDRGPRTQAGVGDRILPLTDWRTSPWLNPIRDQIERRAWMNTQDWADDRQDESDGENVVLWALRKQFGLLAAMRFRQWLAVMAAAERSPSHSIPVRPEPPAQWRLTMVMVPDVAERMPTVVSWTDSPLANDTAGIWGEGGRERQHQLAFRWCRGRCAPPTADP